MRQIVLFIKDVLLNKEFMILSDITANFFELIKAYREDNHCIVNSTPVVFEKFTHSICDYDVSFESLGIESGMYFIVF